MRSTIARSAPLITIPSKKTVSSSSLPLGGWKRPTRHHQAQPSCSPRHHANLPLQRKRRQRGEDVGSSPTRASHRSGTRELLIRGVLDCDGVICACAGACHRGGLVVCWLPCRGSLCLVPLVAIRVASSRSGVEPGGNCGGDISGSEPARSSGSQGGENAENPGSGRPLRRGAQDSPGRERHCCKSSAGLSGERERS